jgi:hypothetical protein
VCFPRNELLIIFSVTGSSNPHTLLERFYFDVSEMLIIFSVAEMRLEQSARFS